MAFNSEIETNDWIIIYTMQLFKNTNYVIISNFSHIYL